MGVALITPADSSVLRTAAGRCLSVSASFGASSPLISAMSAVPPFSVAIESVAKSSMSSGIGFVRTGVGMLGVGKAGRGNGEGESEERSGSE